MSRVLDVYLHDELTGQLIQNKSGGLIFVYDFSYLAQTHNSPALSISLPLQAEPYENVVV